VRYLQENGASSRVDLLGDIGPPPAIERPGMARVTVPVIETTRYSSVAPRAPQNGEAEMSLPSSPNSMSGEGKRKRVDAEDDVFTSSLPMAPPPPKQKANPFARKLGDNTRNPFARRSEPNKTIQKSESFFDKIDAIDEDGGSKSKRPFAKSNGKEKEKTGGGARQVTLFGMLHQPKEKDKQKNHVGRKGVADTTPSPSEANGTQQSDSQATDVVMSDATVVESQAPGSPPWDETQMVDATQETLID